MASNNWKTSLAALIKKHGVTRFTDTDDLGQGP